MKVLFLDVDGVLNNYDLIRTNGLDYIDQSMVRLIGIIVSRTGASVVLSSTWRIKPKDTDMVSSSLGAQGIMLYSKTPVTSKIRAEEISMWLEENPEVELYAILDDDENAGVGLEESFFQTDPEIGITPEIARKVISHLNGSDYE